MKKSTIITIAIVVLTAVAGVCVAIFVNQNAKAKAAEEQARVEQARLDSMELALKVREAELADKQRQQAEEAQKAQEEQRIISFITDMYNNNKYEEYSFLKRHCTPKMLRKLKADYDYDCYDGDCYATWDFRTGAQDSNYPDERNGINSVKHIEGSTYEYDYYDGGWRGRTRINITIVDGVEKIDDVRLVYTDCR